MTPEEINKKAYEKYPVWMDTEYDKYGNAEEIDLNEKARNAYIEAYKEISSMPTIKGWVARDEDGALSFFGSKPYRNFGNWVAGTCIKLNRKLFPALKMKNGPMKVELPIIRK